MCSLPRETSQHGENMPIIGNHGDAATVPVCPGKGKAMLSLLSACGQAVANVNDIIGPALVGKVSCTWQSRRWHWDCFFFCCRKQFQFVKKMKKSLLVGKVSCTWQCKK